MVRVRIKDHDYRPQFSIAVAAGAAVLIWFTILMWSTSTSIRAAQRDLTQVLLTYQCDDGHRFEALAADKSSACAQAGCAARAWPIWSFQCTKHGAFLYQLRYTIDDGGRARIKACRRPGGEWGNVAGNLKCPNCDRALLADFTLRAHLGLAVDRSSSELARPEAQARSLPTSSDE